MPLNYGTPSLNLLSLLIDEWKKIYVEPAYCLYVFQSDTPTSLAHTGRLVKGWREKLKMPGGGASKMPQILNWDAVTENFSNYQCATYICSTFDTVDRVTQVANPSIKLMGRQDIRPFVERFFYSRKPPMPAAPQGHEFVPAILLKRGDGKAKLVPAVERPSPGEDAYDWCQFAMAVCAAEDTGVVCERTAFAFFANGSMELPYRYRVAFLDNEGTIRPDADFDVAEVFRDDRFYVSPGGLAVSDTIAAMSVAVLEWLRRTIEIATNAALLAPANATGTAPPVVVTPAATHIPDTKDRVMLSVLAKNGGRMSQPELAVASVVGGKSLDISTIRERLKRLREAGFVHRPAGERGGDAITELGRKIIGKA